MNVPNHQPRSYENFHLGSLAAANPELMRHYLPDNIPSQPRSQYEPSGDTELAEEFELFTHKPSGQAEAAEQDKPVYPIYPPYPNHSSFIGGENSSSQLATENQPAGPVAKKSHKLTAAVAGIAVAASAIFGIGAALAKPKEIAGTAMADQQALEQLFDNQENSPLNGTPADADQQATGGLSDWEERSNGIIPGSNPEFPGEPDFGGDVSLSDIYANDYDKTHLPDGSYINLKRSSYQPVKLDAEKPEQLLDQIAANINCVYNSLDADLIRQCIDNITGEAKLPWDQCSVLTQTLFNAASHSKLARQTYDTTIFTQTFDFLASNMWGYEYTDITAKSWVNENNPSSATNRERDTKLFHFYIENFDVGDFRVSRIDDRTAN